jgi:hypothetical protein
MKPASPILKIRIMATISYLIIIAGLFVILLVCGIVLSSCSVVKTEFDDQPDPECTLYYYLPVTLLKIKATAQVAVCYSSDQKLTDSSKLLQEKFLIITETIADSKNLLTLNYKTNVMANDDVKYKINAKGLLESVDITTEDRTAEIVTKLTEAPAVILKSTDTGRNRAEDKFIYKIKEFSDEFCIAADSSMNDHLFTWNIEIPNEMGINEMPKFLKAGFRISSPDLGKKKKDQVIEKTASKQVIDQMNDDAKNKKDDQPVNRKLVYDGLLTRPVKNINLCFNLDQDSVKKHGAGKEFIANQIPPVLIVDFNRLICIPVQRTPFVKRINSIAFQDGLILNNDIVNPSSVEGFVSIPINVAKAIVSIPGQLIQFRYDNTKRLDSLEKIKLDYEKSIQAAKTYNQTKDQEFEKLIFDLQKSVNDAEAKRIESQKTLDSLKSEIEKLKNGNTLLFNKKKAN